MPEIDFSEMSHEEIAKTANNAAAFLRALEERKQDKRGEEEIWVRRPDGRPRLVKRRLWDSHLARQQDKGWRLMSEDEVQAEQDKIANARKERERKQELWRLLPREERRNPNILGDPIDPAAWQEYSIEELEEMVERFAPEKSTKSKK